MNRETFLALGVKPALLTTEEAAWVLGLHEDAINHLAKLGHLPTIGKAQLGVCRLFSSRQLHDLASDPKWLHKAVSLIRHRVATRNQTARARRAALNSPAQ